jgi:hypothetical protein
MPKRDGRASESAESAHGDIDLQSQLQRLTRENAALRRRAALTGKLQAVHQQLARQAEALQAVQQQLAAPGDW